VVATQSIRAQTGGQTRDLQYYTGIALAGSPLLKDYAGQAAINSLDSLIGRAAYRPQVAAALDGRYAPGIAGFHYDRTNIDEKNLGALLTVSQTIVGGRNLGAQMASYGIAAQGLGNARKISEHDLRLAVATQYIVSWGALQEAQYNGDILSLLVREELMLKKLTEKAVYKQTDYLNFEVGMHQQQLLVDQLRAGYRDQIALLNYLCGIVDTTQVALEAPNIALLPPPAFEATLQYDKFFIDSLRLNNSAKLIDYAYRPKLSAYADGGYSSTFVSTPQKNFGASIGLSLSIPIYDGGQRQREHNKIKTSEQIRSYYRDFAKRQYDQQVADLFRQLAQTDTVIAQAEQVIKYSQALIDAYGKQMQTGEASITDYMNALANLIIARQALTRNNTTKLQIISQINYWNNEE